MGAPRRIIFNASSTASLGRVCARDGGVGGALRLSDALAFVIKHPPAWRVPAVLHKQMPSTCPLTGDARSSPDIGSEAILSMQTRKPSAHFETEGPRPVLSRSL